MESYDNVILFFFFFTEKSRTTKTRFNTEPCLSQQYRFLRAPTLFFFFFFYFAKTFLRGFTIENFLPCKRGGRKISKHKRTRITEIRLPSLSSRRRLHVSFFFYHLFSYPIKRLNCERLITSIAIF